MSGEVTKADLIAFYAATHPDAVSRQREVFPKLAQISMEVERRGFDRDVVEDVFNRLVSQVPGSESEVWSKMDEASSLLGALASANLDGFSLTESVRKDNFSDFLAQNVLPGLSDLEARRDTEEARETLRFAKALIGLRLIAIKEAEAWMGRGGPQIEEAGRALRLSEYREKYDEPLEWKGRPYQRRLMEKMCNILLVAGPDSPDIRGFLTLIQSRASQYGSMGDYAKAIARLVGDEKGGPLQAILTVGARSGANIESLQRAIGSLVPGDIVAFANLTWSFVVQGERRSLSVGQVLEKLLTLPNGRKAWNDRYWTGELTGADPLIADLFDPNNGLLRGIESGILLDPGWKVYKDGEPRWAGVMDRGETDVRDVPHSELQTAMIDGSPIIKLFVYARALGILTQPISRLYGENAINEALPALQKIWGPMYERYYRNQTPYFRLRGFLSLMSMVDRAVQSPLTTIRPIPENQKTMDGFAFMEIRDQEIARGGIVVDKQAVREDLITEAARQGRRLEGVELQLELNDRLNLIDVLLLHLWGMPVDSPADMYQERVVGDIVGVMNDQVITDTCEVKDNPIRDPNVRREIALQMARDFFEYQIDLAMKHTDKRVHSLDSLFTYVKFVHLPPEMIKHRLELLDPQYSRLLEYVDFSGLLERWKGLTPEEANLAQARRAGESWVGLRGVNAAIRAAEAMGAGVMATLPGGTVDLNSPFLEKQANYWGAELEMYKLFTQGWPIAIQAIDDEALKRAGVRINPSNESKEVAYEMSREAWAAWMGINPSEKMRSGAIEEFIKWIRSADKVTFIGGKAPVRTFFHMAAAVAASMVGIKFVPQYLNPELTCYIVDGKRKYSPIGVNDDVMQYGANFPGEKRRIYPNLPSDLLAMVGVEVDASGKGLISPARIASFPVIGMQQRQHVFKGRAYTVFGPTRRVEDLVNPSEYAGSLRVFPDSPKKAFNIMLELALRHLYDLGLVDPAEKHHMLAGMEAFKDYLPDEK